MSSHVLRIHKEGLISPPKFVPESIQYEVLMGSVAYGVSNDMSDIDLYGFCMPPKDMVFPHLVGHIEGFGRHRKRFDQFSQHHIPYDGNEYDISIYNIVKYFQLCMENNPNMIDSLFVPERAVLHSTKIGDMVREKRTLFLHKGSWHKFKGYAYSQLHKIDNKNPVGKRKELVDKFGYDVKFAYHVVRLIDEVEQIMIEHDIDLERNREQLKSIRRGEWALEELRDWFYAKEKSLGDVYTKSTLRHSPDEEAVKELLLNCLEEYYGSLDKCIVIQKDSDVILSKIKELLGT